MKNKISLYKMALVEFEFIVSLTNKYDERHIAYDPEIVVLWYRNQLADVASIYDLQIIDIAYVRDDIYKVSYMMSQESDENIKVINYLLVDPDDDGNYPITIDQVEYLVSGRMD